MNKPPQGWPRITAAVFYDDAAKAIDWLCAAFGFEVRLKIEGEGGRIEHSELTFGEGVIMVASTGGKSTRPRPIPCKSPRALGGVNAHLLSPRTRRCLRLHPGKDLEMHHVPRLQSISGLAPGIASAFMGSGEIRVDQDCNIEIRGGAVEIVAP